MSAKDFPHLPADIRAVFADYDAKLADGTVGSEWDYVPNGYVEFPSYGPESSPDWLAHAAKHTRGIYREPN
jgi:hypothetical protein